MPKSARNATVKPALPRRGFLLCLLLFGLSFSSLSLFGLPLSGPLFSGLLGPGKALAAREARNERPPETQNMQLARQRLESYNRAVEVNARFQEHSLYLVGEDGSASPLPDLLVRHVRAGAENGNGSAEYPFAHPEEAFAARPDNNFVHLLIYIWPGNYESDGAFQNFAFNPLRLYTPTTLAGAGQPLVLTHIIAGTGAAGGSSGTPSGPSGQSSQPSHPGPASPSVQAGPSGQSGLFSLGAAAEPGLIIPAQAEGASVWSLRNYGRPPDSPFWPVSGNNFAQHPENEAYRLANLLIWPAPGVPLTLSGLDLRCSDGSANAIHMEAELSQETGLAPKVVRPSGLLTLHNTNLEGFRVALGTWDAVCLVAGNSISHSRDFALLGEGWLGGRSALLMGRNNEISQSRGACAVQAGQAEAGENNHFNGNRGLVFYARQLVAVSANHFTENGSAAQVLELELGRGNHISKNRFDGVRVRYSAKIGQENFISENGGNGLMLSGRDSNESLRLGNGNRIFGNHQAGLRVGAADLIMGDNNHIYGNFDQGIILSPPKPPASLGAASGPAREYKVELGKNNRITGNGKEGVFCRGRLISERGNLIKGNSRRQYQDVATPGGALFRLPGDKISLSGFMLHLKNELKGEQP